MTEFGFFLAFFFVKWEIHLVSLFDANMKSAKQYECQVLFPLVLCSLCAASQFKLADEMHWIASPDKNAFVQVLSKGYPSLGGSNDTNISMGPRGYGRFSNHRKCATKQAKSQIAQNNEFVRKRGDKRILKLKLSSALLFLLVSELKVLASFYGALRLVMANGAL